MALAVSGSVSPFAFTSEKELSESSSWFLMWINPQTLNYDFQNQQSEFLVSEGYGYQHWQGKLPKINFSGKSGYLFGQQNVANIPNAGSPENFDSASGTFTKVQGSAALSGIETAQKKMEESKFFEFSGSNKAKKQTNFTSVKAREAGSQLIFTGSTVFYRRLQRIALEEKFFFDTSKGYRRYNKKYLKIFTKNHPQGLTLGGFFDSFEIAEDAMDVIAIPYTCSFVVQEGLNHDDFDELDMLNYFNTVEKNAIRTQTTQQSKNVTLTTDDVYIYGQAYVAKNLSPYITKIRVPNGGPEITPLFNILDKEGLILGTAQSTSYLNQELRVEFTTL